jgi:hypothetical protein
VRRTRCVRVTVRPFTTLVVTTVSHHHSPMRAVYALSLRALKDQNGM